MSHKREERSKEYAKELLKEEMGRNRYISKPEKTLIRIIAIAWALFQLSISSWLILDSTTIRAIHLAFAITLVFLTQPFSKHPTRWKKFSSLTTTSRIPFMDFALAILACFSALYIFLNQEALAARAGNPTVLDIVAGIVLVLLVIEGARRSIGAALSIIALLFTAYAFLGPYMPSIFAFKGVDLTNYLNQISLSTEGIFGIPLGVSASTIFLYVLMGGMLEFAGGGKFFTRLALAALGKYRGGPAKAAVFSSGLTGMVSGSSVANIVTTGTFTIPMMQKVGYPGKIAAATEVAASTNGQLMPPIMGAAAFIIAEYVNVPYIEVVKAAAIPALISYFALFYIAHLEACKLGMRGLTKEERPSLKKTLKEGFHFLIPLVVLIFELVVMRYSPAKSAFWAILVLMAVIFYQEIMKVLKLHKINNKTKAVLTGLHHGLISIRKGMVNGSRNMIVVALATAAAGIIVGVINLGIGGMLTQIVEQLSMNNVFLLLIITAVASLLLGMGLPTTATYIVMASLTAPIIVTLGAKFGMAVPLMAAHLFCFYFGILADDTPPVGLAAYAAAAIAKTDPVATGLKGFSYDLRTAVIPFMFVFNQDLILQDINSWPLGLLIFAMATLGCFTFTSAAQGWFLIKSKIHEIVLMLVATVIFFYPGLVNKLLSIPEEYKYYLYLTAFIPVGLVYLSQKMRTGNKAVTA